MQPWGGYKNLPSHNSWFGVCSAVQIERTSARLQSDLNLDVAFAGTCSFCITRSFTEICKIYMNNTVHVLYGHSECFYCGLCKNAVSTASHNIVIDELGRICNRSWPTRNAIHIYAWRKWGKSVRLSLLGSIFEPGIYRKRVESDTAAVFSIVFY